MITLLKPLSTGGNISVLMFLLFCVLYFVSYFTIASLHLSSTVVFVEYAKWLVLSSTLYVHTDFVLSKTILI